MRRRSKRRPVLHFFIKLIVLALVLFILSVYSRSAFSGIYTSVIERFFPPSGQETVIESAAVEISDKRDEAMRESAGILDIREVTTQDAVTEIRNDTSYDIDLSELAQNAIKLNDGSEPQVLIVHTHTSEAYTPDDEYFYEQDDVDRTIDPEFNVVAVGTRITELLEDAGIGVIHDETLNDYPSYNKSYNRMLEIIEAYLEEYPSISIVLDIHRDAVIYDDGTRYAPRVQIGGKSAAQVMMVVGTDEGGLRHDNWRANLSFALAIQTTAENNYPGLMRLVNLRSSRFNGHTTSGSLIVEVGSSGNTLGEALYGAELFTKALIETVKR